ncbi:MAG: hypothetical protein NC453_17250 [Muribaculum sp.]|nr:hypothetical protein [Muribaculum sp.]
MNRTLSIFIACIFVVCAFADNKVITPSTPKAPQNEQVILRKRTDNKIFRAPSNNPAFQILGEYDENGILYIFTGTESDWELIISSTDGDSVYFVTAPELQVGIHIGIMSEFYITLTADSGETFVGEFYSE